MCTGHVYQNKQKLFEYMCMFMYSTHMLIISHYKFAINDEPGNYPELFCSAAGDNDIIETSLFCHHRLYWFAMSHAYCIIQPGWDSWLASYM